MVFCSCRARSMTTGHLALSRAWSSWAVGEREDAVWSDMGCLNYPAAHCPTVSLYQFDQLVCKFLGVFPGGQTDVKLQLCLPASGPLSGVRRNAVTGPPLFQADNFSGCSFLRRSTGRHIGLPVWLLNYTSSAAAGLSGVRGGAVISHRRLRPARRPGGLFPTLRASRVVQPLVSAVSENLQASGLSLIAANLSKHRHAIGYIRWQSAAATATAGERLDAILPDFLLFNGLLKHERDVRAQRTPLRVGNSLRLLI